MYGMHIWVPGLHSLRLQNNYLGPVYILEEHMLILYLPNEDGLLGLL